ncbi:replication initiation protein [Vagococcus fluvialis]|uniref:replication initiation protein n=1 Tax=Vagococcus fluvialis TaxID=2738 RepID=UPI001D0AD218|nr:replication initiation protein [Vagococcus fluvialis]UDM84074.1 replication initiation protein [Vagococcus fluvialis]
MGTIELIDNKNYLVVRKNDIIQKTTNNFSLMEKKLLLIAISKIKKGDSSDELYELKTTELLEMLGMKKGGYSYKLIRDSIKSLSDKSEWFYDEESKKSILIRWLIEVEEKGGTFRFAFQKNIRNYIFEIKDRFTEFELWNILLLKNKTTVDIYEYLKSFENLNTVDIPLIDFNVKFNTKQLIYTDINRLEHEIKEKNKSITELNIVNNTKNKLLKSLSKAEKNKIEKDNKELLTYQQGIADGTYIPFKTQNEDSNKVIFYHKKNDSNYDFDFYKVDDVFYIKKYDRYTDVKRFIIEKAKLEIEEYTDLKFEYSEITEKGSKKVVGITFIINSLEGDAFDNMKNKIEYDLLSLNVPKDREIPEFLKDKLPKAKDLKDIKKEKKENLDNIKKNLDKEKREKKKRP